MSYLHYDSNDRDDGTFRRCPFCGGDADLRIYSVPFTALCFYYVSCLVCGAMTQPCDLTPEEAIKRWNRRRGKGG